MCHDWLLCWGSSSEKICCWRCCEVQKNCTRLLSRALVARVVCTYGGGGGVYTLLWVTGRLICITAHLFWVKLLALQFSHIHMCMAEQETWTGSGIAQWLERRTHDWKVAGSNPYRSGGRIFFSRVDFLCWLLFRYPFHPRVTAAARKRPRLFCQKRGWQVTAKHAYTLRMWLCMKWHGAWLYGVHRMRWNGSSFVWHQPCQRCKYTTSVDIQKTRYKKLFTYVESHASAVSLLESGEWRYIKVINNNNNLL